MRLAVVILLSSLAFGQGTVMPILGTTAPGGGGGGSNPTVAQHAIDSTGVSGAGSLTVSISSTAANHAIVACLANDNANTVATPTTTGTSCTLTEVANTKQTPTGNNYSGMWVGTNCGAGVTGVAIGGFGIYRLAVFDIANANTVSPVDVSTSATTTYGGGASWSSGATGSMASGNGVILGCANLFRQVGGTETYTPGAGFTALDTTNNSGGNGTSMFTEKWEQPGVTTGKACNGTIGVTNGNEQLTPACLVIK